MNAIAKTEAIAATHKSVHAALAAAQAEMGPAIKDSVNPHLRNKYADLASVMAACMPALNRHGIAVIQPPYDDDSGRYVKTIFIHGETGDSLECRVPLIVQKNDMQGYGSAVTYARRYGLMSMAGIAPDDDDGNAAASAAPKKDQRRQDPPKQQSRGAEPSPAEIAINSLSNADTLDRLQGIWGSIPNDIRADTAVIAAKDARKAALDNNADIGGDEIPY